MDIQDCMYYILYIDFFVANFVNNAIIIQRSKYLNNEVVLVYDH